MIEKQERKYLIRIKKAQDMGLKQTFVTKCLLAHPSKAVCLSGISCGFWKKCTQLHSDKRKNLDTATKVANPASGE